VHRLALGRQARSVEDVAVDAGRVLYSTSARGHTKRARSSLWTARLDGRALTTPKRGATTSPSSACSCSADERERLKVPGTARAETSDMNAAYDPITDRLLLSSYEDGSGGFQIGWSSVLGS